MLSHQHLVGLARTAARAGAHYLAAVERPYTAEWERKAPRDFVTAIDRTAEGIITEILLAAEPESVILGEELSPTTVPTGLVWIVDPLDGTTNFLHGFATWAISIGIAVDGKLVGGVVHDVPRDLVYHAAQGTGAWRGEDPIFVSAIRDPALALIGTGFPFKEMADADRYLAQFKKVMAATSGIRRPGAASLDLAGVASGTFDGFWELMLAPWDVAAGIVLIREAGGRVTDFDGGDPGLAPSGIVAGNPWIHQWLIDTLQG